MKAKLIRIGNSRGVRLPKAMIEQAGLGEDIELTLRGDQIVLASPKHPRAGWAPAIKAAVAKHGHDVDEEFLALPIDFSEREWTGPSPASTSTSSRSIRRSARK